MPGLFAFGRRWHVGSDDLLYPALLECGIRIIWVTMLIGGHEFYREPLDQCTGGAALRIYLIGTIVINCICIVLDVVTVLIASRGAIMAVHARRRITTALYLRTAMAFPEIVWNILGTVWVCDDSVSCKDSARHVVGAVTAVVIASWFMLALCVIGVFVVFDSTGQNANLAESYAVSVWEKRCRLICCWFGVQDDAHMKSAFGDISQLLSGYFSGVDWVPSDIAAALVLLRTSQEKQRSTAPSQTSEHHRQSWMTVDYAAHFMRYAVAAYGWPLYMYTNLCTGLCRLRLSCCCWAPKQHEDIHNDNCCQCHGAALKKQTSLIDDDIVYVDFYDGIYEIPFVVCFDHKTHSVVIAIRGTLSLRDALTDLTAGRETISVQQHGPESEEIVAHKGILQAARYIHGVLIQRNVLKMALHLRENYSVVVVGHSLGAGAAALLSILLKPQFPNIRCFAYSPPGGLLKCSAQQQQNILSVILGADLFSRVGIAQLENLKVKITKELNDCPMSKHKVLLDGCYMCCCCCWPGTTEQYSSRLPLLRENPVEEDETAADVHEELCLPGTVMHIVDDGDGGSCCFGTSKKYHVSWPQKQTFRDIVVHPNMLSDHMPHTLLSALQVLEKSDDDLVPVIQVIST